MAAASAFPACGDRRRTSGATRTGSPLPQGWPREIRSRPRSSSGPGWSTWEAARWTAAAAGGALDAGFTSWWCRRTASPPPSPRRLHQGAGEGPHAATTYYYRFSFVQGRTRYRSTRADPHRARRRADVPVRFAVANCQDYVGRYWNRYQQMLTLRPTTSTSSSPSGTTSTRPPSRPGPWRATGDHLQPSPPRPSTSEAGTSRRGAWELPRPLPDLPGRTPWCSKSISLADHRHLGRPRVRGRLLGIDRRPTSTAGRREGTTSAAETPSRSSSSTCRSTRGAGERSEHRRG
jgi:hypothetical protein